MGEPREDGVWRAVRRHPPPPPATCEAVVDGLARLQSAARASQGGEDVDAASAVLACSVADETAAPLPWGGERGGDARLRLLVPSLAKKLAGLRARVASCQWGIVASHLPGRTGAECRERWAELEEMEAEKMEEAEAAEVEAFEVSDEEGAQVESGAEAMEVDAAVVVAEGEEEQEEDGVVEAAVEAEAMEVDAAVVVAEGEEEQ